MRFRSAHAVAIVAAAVIAAFSFVSPSRADLLITVDKSTQRMSVVQDGTELFNWPVSTGVTKHDTPNGNYMPFRMEKEHFSKEWDDAPMPHSIFFTKRGHAIHGTTHKSLGRPASHGCVRLDPKNAALLFDLVTLETIYKTRVVITGDLPSAPLVAGRDAGSRSTAPRRNAPDFEQSFSTDDVTASIPPADIPDYTPRRERQRVYRDGVQPRDQGEYRMYRGRMVRMFYGRDGRLYYEYAPSYARPRYVEPRRYGSEVPPPGYYYQR